MMLPDIPETLSSEELLALFNDEDASHASKYGITLDNPSEWHRYRKYAFGRYWERRLADDDKFTQGDVDALVAALKCDLVRSITLGYIGDSARVNKLTFQMAASLQDLVSADEYAGRQLRARIVLFKTPEASKEAVESLLSVRAAWALRQLAVNAKSEEELRIVEASLEDKRLYRSHRHTLREVIRHKQKEFKVERERLTK